MSAFFGDIMFYFLLCRRYSIYHFSAHFRRVMLVSLYSNTLRSIYHWMA